MYAHFHVKGLLLRSDFHLTRTTPGRLSKNTQKPNLNKDRPVGGWGEFYHTDGRTDMKKLAVAFRNSANAPNENRLTKITCKRPHPRATDDIQLPRDPNWVQQQAVRFWVHLHKWRQAGKQSTPKSTAGTERAIHTLHNQPSTAMVVKNPSIFGTSNILVARDEMISCKWMKLSSQNSRSHYKNLIYIQVMRSAYPQTHWALSTEYWRRDFKLMPHFFSFQTPTKHDNMHKSCK